MLSNSREKTANNPVEPLDTSSHSDFYRYYETQSLSDATLERFRSTTQSLLGLYGTGNQHRSLQILDVGCGAGAQARFWLGSGHHYCGIDINRPLIELARERARREGLDARFEVGTATALPLDDRTIDICVLPELLEHVQDWQACLDEALRVMRPGGLVYINTSSRLCPVQQEFNLPLYSWYPGAIKRYFERRAVTDWPAVANFAKYPAVNWFSFYQLSHYLRARGFESWDRFDMAKSSSNSGLRRIVLRIVTSIAPLRFLGHLFTPYTLLVARKLV